MVFTIVTTTIAQIPISGMQIALTFRKPSKGPIFMRSIKTVLTSAVVLLSTTVSAMAQSSRAEVPEPDTIALISLAMAGIILGCRWAAKRPPKD